MKAAVVITTLVLGFFAQASPLDTAASVSKNNKYDIKWCKKEHYKNCYEYEDLYTDRCYDLDSDYSDKTESVRHGSKVDCYYYEDYKCKGDYFSAKGNYEELPKKWKHEISSWKCYEEDNKDRR